MSAVDPGNVDPNMMINLGSVNEGAYKDKEGDVIPKLLSNPPPSNSNLTVSESFYQSANDVGEFLKSVLTSIALPFQCVGSSEARSAVKLSASRLGAQVKDTFSLIKLKQEKTEEVIKAELTKGYGGMLGVVTTLYEVDQNGKVSVKEDSKAFISKRDAEDFHKLMQKAYPGEGSEIDLSRLDSGDLYRINLISDKVSERVGLSDFMYEYKEGTVEKNLYTEDEQKFIDKMIKKTDIQKDPIEEDIFEGKNAVPLDASDRKKLAKLMMKNPKYALKMRLDFVNSKQVKVNKDNHQKITRLDSNSNSIKPLSDFLLERRLLDDNDIEKIKKFQEDENLNESSMQRLYELDRKVFKPLFDLREGDYHYIHEMPGEEWTKDVFID